MAAAARGWDRAGHAAPSHSPPSRRRVRWRPLRARARCHADPPYSGFSHRRHRLLRSRRGCLLRGRGRVLWL